LDRPVSPNQPEFPAASPGTMPQVLQGAVPISLLIALTRKPVRDRFAKQQYG